ncbi:MAG: S8 family peptidase [Candidatus Omnitrophica bacterium]|nr:S8 family peptidase [Candidatus Omnitrophota bacterium]
MPNKRFQHLFIKEAHTAKNFTSTSSGGTKPRIPVREIEAHSRFLQEKFNAAWTQAQNKQAVIHAAREGVYIEFKGDPGYELVTKSLEDMRSKRIRLLNVRTEKEGELPVIYATVYVPNDKKNHFLKKIQEYAAEKLETDPPKNASLINSIADIREAIMVESFWQDKKELIPSTDGAWCEVWLSSDKEAVLQRFNDLLVREEIRAADGLIKFPERMVKLIFVNKRQLERLTTLSDDIAEYRLAKETAALLLEMENKDQMEWVKDLLSRCQVNPNPNVSVCILDSGVNNGHPLLSLVLNNDDCQAVDNSWGVDDHDGHGTLMAGLSAYGDLLACLFNNQAVRLYHCLESVKMLPPPPQKNEVKLWGYITDQAVSKAEIKAPERKRIVCMAITSTDTRDQGRPSSWSGRIDQLAIGEDNGNKRLFIISAGNMDIDSILNYPDAQEIESVHDPAQSWNALVVGAYTKFDQITDRTFAGFIPVAKAGGLSPFSTTSQTWEGKWPVKPDIVMEGGNVIHDGKGFWDHPGEVSLLSTYRDTTKSHFRLFNMTSAATAQAAWFAAQIQNIYPDIWPETIRALMVHSSEWTDTLKAQFLPAQPTKTDYSRLLRICGYGVPNLTRALYSAANNLTLIAQSELQPYDREEGASNYKTKEMHLYDLPWPKEVLQELPPDIKVQMRITLSYFVEPGPGEIGWRDRYRYASHALRFDIKSPSETKELFQKRINLAAREEKEGHPGTQGASDHWTIGSNGRDKGSIHSDIWDGNAADLAESGVIAVYPVIGWWRERAYLGRWNQKCRYSIIVSIMTPEEKIDIYTPVAHKIGIAVPIPIS